MRIYSLTGLIFQVLSWAIILAWLSFSEFRRMKVIPTENVFSLEPSAPPILYACVTEMLPPPRPPEIYHFDAAEGISPELTSCIQFLGDSLPRHITIAISGASQTDLQFFTDLATLRQPYRSTLLLKSDTILLKAGWRHAPNF